MKKRRVNRIATIVAGVLIVAIVAFLAVGLFVEGSWPNDLLSGTAFQGSREPTVFPADDLPPDSSIPKGSGMEGGMESVDVTLQALWDGSCAVWGTTAAYPTGHKFSAGTFKVVVQGQYFVGYCIDLGHSVKVGDTWPANIYATTETQLCSVQWILANYSRSNPGPGLTAKEEGVAIQAALWYYSDGFQPVWDAANWCAKQAVFDRTMAIINAAQGQCIPIPSSLDVTAPQPQYEPGQTADLSALVQDQRGLPYQGQDVAFTTSLGNLGLPSAATDAQGQAPNTLTSNEEGMADVVVDMSGTAGTAAVDPVGVSKQRLIIVKPIPYSGEDELQIEWFDPTAVFLRYFTAAWAGGSGGEGQEGATEIVLRWETASEVDNLGFNVYRGPSAEGPWTKLNTDLIPPGVPPGSLIGATYEWTDKPEDPQAELYYLLEDVDIYGTTTQHGPAQP